MVSEDNVTAIKLAQLADQKATTPTVRRLARRLIAEHSRAQEEFTNFARGVGEIAPNYVKSGIPRNYDNLWTQNGINFEHGYLQQVVGDLQAAVGQYQNEVGNGLGALRRQANEAKNLQQRLSNVGSNAGGGGPCDARVNGGHAANGGERAVGSGSSTTAG